MFKKIFKDNSDPVSPVETQHADMPREEQREKFTFTFYGANAELHDRISGAQGNFHAKYELMRTCLIDESPFRIVAGISRYNFTILHEIINFCFSLYGEEKRFTDVFNIFPTKTISSRFHQYVSHMQEELKFQDRVLLEYADEDFANILSSFEKQIHHSPMKERDYVRYLSMICEKTFIGPATIVMDPFHRCNTNCRHCWVHTPVITQPQEFLDRKLDLDLFKSIVDDASELKTDLIILQGDGEPLMYPHTMEMLRYIRHKDIEAMFFTNGALLTEARAKQIIEMDVKEIYCSLPAGTAETYGRVCPAHEGDDFFERIATNMKNFIRLRKKMGKERPRLVMTHVMHSENYKDLIPMAELDAEIGADAVRFYLIRLDTMNMDLMLKKEMVESMIDDLDTAEKIIEKANIHFIDNVRFQFEHYDQDTGAWCEDVFLKEGCSIGYYFCLIPALTDLSLCCHLRTIGWLKDIRFKDLWLSPEYERYRRQAKYLRHNKDVTFMNGTKLYDEHCTHCDNHQTLINNTEDLKRLGWYQYLNIE